MGIALFTRLNIERSWTGAATFRVRWDNAPATEVRFLLMDNSNGLQVDDEYERAFIANLRSRNRLLLELVENGTAVLHQWSLMGANAAISQLPCVR